MKCLIIAAGKGSRLQHKSVPKPLVKLAGVPIIERVIRTAIKAGADDIYVVTGNKNDTISSFLSNLSKKLNVNITTLYNEKWETTENGYSVLKAKNYISEPFLLLMGDHFVEKEIIEEVLNENLNENEIILGVDVRKENEFVDYLDATKVKFIENKIIDIGKNLKEFDGYDTGVFYCSPHIFKALEEAEKNGETTLSSAVKILSENGLAKVKKISNGVWIDIDTEIQLKKAEDYLFEKLKNKLTDGIVSRKINRPISIKITKFLINYNITPNQISVFSFLLSCFSAYLFSAKSYWGLFFGAILSQFSSILDGCDGEIARLKYLSSKYGAWLDAVLDRYADGFLLWGLMWHGVVNSYSLKYVFWGTLAIIGSFIVSYTADKYDSLMKQKIISSKIRIGRDLRIFIISLGAILSLVNLTLAIIAIIMNIEAIRRIWLCRERI